MDTVKLEWPIEILWHDGEKWRPFADSDPNAAMIWRDEPKTYSFSCDPRDLGAIFCADDVIGRDMDSQYVDWVCAALVVEKSTAKQAITGLTTVHDGKARGLGFCSEA